MFKYSIYWHRNLHKHRLSHNVQSLFGCSKTTYQRTYASHNPNLQSVEGIILFSHLYMLKSSENEINSCNLALRKMGLLFLRQIFWWLIHDFFTLQMAVRSKNAMKCTLYFVRKCYLLEQNRNISGVSTSKLVRNSNGVHSANMFTNWTPQEDRTGYRHLYWFNLLRCDSAYIINVCVCCLI